MPKLPAGTFEPEYYGIDPDTIKHRPFPNCMHVPSALIEAFQPQYAGELGALFVGLGAALMRRASQGEKDKAYVERSERRDKAGALVDRIENAVSDIAYSVQRGSALKEAIASASQRFKVAQTTLNKAVHMSAPHIKAIRRVEMARLIDIGWPLEKIAAYLDVHRATVWREKKRLTLGSAICHHTESSDT